MKLSPPRPCRPPYWALHGHLQTVIGSLWPAPPLTLPFTRLEIPLVDGDRLVVRCFASAHPLPQPIIACLFHGLGGHDDRPYIRRTVRLLNQRGVHVWTINHRGCGIGRGFAKGTYHSGVAADLGEVFAFARQHSPQARILGIGFSLSANALLLNLGDGLRGPHPKPDAAIAVNPPVNLARCSELISMRRHRIYDKSFIRTVLRSVREREADGLIPRDKYPVHAQMTLQEFDDAFTAPASGFVDRHDYYARCSAEPHLYRIETPTVILHAEDDPLIDARDLRQARLGPGVHLQLEQHGGHLGYLCREQPSYRWLDYALGHFVDELRAGGHL